MDLFGMRKKNLNLYDAQVNPKDELEKEGKKFLEMVIKLVSCEEP